MSVLVRQGGVVVDESRLRVALEAALASLNRTEASPLLDEIWGRYRDDHRHQKSHRVMCIRITNVLRWVYANVGVEATVADITPTLWAAYRVERKRAVQPISVNLELDALKIMFNWARQNGLLRVNPLQDVRRERVRTERETIIPPSVLAQILAHANPQLRLLVSVMAASGMRANEAIRLRVDELDKSGIITLARQRKKNNQPHELFIGRTGLDDLQTWLAEHPDNVYVVERPATGRPYSYNRVRDWWRDAVAASGVEQSTGRLRMHDLRHTLATNMARAGESIRVIQKQLGHSDIKTTVRYLHAQRSDLHSARNRYDAMVSKTQGSKPTSDKGEK